jgi:tetratricopeptide (TPR) repeat protein
MIDTDTDEGVEWVDLLGGGSLIQKVVSFSANTENHKPADGQEVVIRIVGRTLLPNYSNAASSSSASSEQDKQQQQHMFDEPTQVINLRNMLPGCVFASHASQMFHAGENEVPTGLDLGIRLSTIGDCLRLRMISRLGYGVHGLPSEADTKTATFQVLPNQPIEYEVEVLSFGKLRRPVDAMSIEECVVEASCKCDLGTLAYKRGDHELASSLYGRGLKFVQPNQEQVTQALLDVYVRIGTNLALTFSKTKRSDREITKLCRSVLSVDETSTKAWYQLGCALRRLLEYDESKLCLERVLQLDSSSVSGRKELERLQKNVLKYKKRERKMFNHAGRDIFASARVAKEEEEIKKEEEKEMANQAKVKAKAKAKEKEQEQEQEQEKVAQRKQKADSSTPRDSVRRRNGAKSNINSSLLKGEGEEEREWQPYSEVCRRGTQVAKLVGVTMALLLLALTWIHWTESSIV